MVPSACFTGETSTGSQSIGASAAANILIISCRNTNNMRYLMMFCNHAIYIVTILNITYFWTATAISGPIPSPGIRVTVLLPGAELINL